MEIFFRKGWWQEIKGQNLNDNDEGDLYKTKNLRVYL